MVSGAYLFLFYANDGGFWLASDSSTKDLKIVNVKVPKITCPYVKMKLNTFCIVLKTIDVCYHESVFFEIMTISPVHYVTSH